MLQSRTHGMLNRRSL